MVRPIDTVAEFSATLDGLSRRRRTHPLLDVERGFWHNPVDAFFPGFVVIVAGGCGDLLGRPPPWPDDGGRCALNSHALTRRRIVMLVAIAATGFVLSLGTRTPVYGWVYHVFPPMQGLRAAARFGNLFLLGMAVLAAFGLAGLRRRLPAPLGRPRRRRSRRAREPRVAARAVSLHALRGHSGDLLAARERARPRRPGEVPFYPPQGVFENGAYVLNSTAHWRPLMNGYSGYTPGAYREYAATFWYFPQEHAIQAMRRAGVTHVMVHPAGSAPRPKWQRCGRTSRRARISNGSRRRRGGRRSTGCSDARGQLNRDCPRGLSRLSVLELSYLPVAPNPPRDPARSSPTSSHSTRGDGSRMPCAMRSPLRDLHRRGREVERRNLDLVGRAAVVGVDDADAVGDHQPALERRAAAREDARGTCPPALR